VPDEQENAFTPYIKTWVYQICVRTPICNQLQNQKDFFYPHTYKICCPTYRKKCRMKQGQVKLALNNDIVF